MTAIQTQTMLPPLPPLSRVEASTMIDATHASGICGL